MMLIVRIYVLIWNRSSCYEMGLQVSREFSHVRRELVIFYAAAGIITRGDID